jgi:hypothetical protein
MKYIVVTIALLWASCITVKFQPLPVVLSWGGITPDAKLVKVKNPNANTDGGLTIRDPDAGIRETECQNGE